MTEDNKDKDINMTLELIGNSRDLTKEVESTQISDRITSFNHKGGITPPYNPSKLASILELNGTHAIAVEKKSKREVGHGFEIVPHPRADDPSEEEYEIVENFWRGREMSWWIGLQSNIPASPIEVLELARRDYHAIGWMTLELLYNANNELKGMAYCPAESIRLRKAEEEAEVNRRHGFIQKKGSNFTYFAEAGARFKEDPIYIDSKTGEVSSSPANIGQVANELLYIPNPSGLTDYYGVPPWVAEIQTILMDRKARKFNYDFFEYDAMPQLAVLVKNGKLRKESKENLTKMIENLREKEGRRVALLEAESLTQRGLDIDGDVEIELKELGKLGEQDLSFSKLRRMNEHDIAKVHEIPHVLISRLESTNRANSREQIKDFVDDVIKPNQNRFASRLYKIIHQTILGVDDWTIEFIVKGAEDELRQVQIAETKIRSLQGLLTVNEAREELGFEPLEDEIGDMYLAEVTELLSPVQEMGRSLEQIIRGAKEDLREELEIEQAMADDE